MMFLMILARFALYVTLGVILAALFIYAFAVLISVYL